MLDNRFNFDKKTGDRLGEDQWNWLDEALKRGNERNVTATVIGAGVQMLPDRHVVESFKWKNKEKLFAALKKHKVSDVTLLSGDVHMGHMYENQCRSLTGQDTLLEVTSSGLSHTQSNFFPWA